MATSRQFLDYVLEQLSGLEDVRVRPMMGEYLLYSDGVLFGGIYDDRFLLKDVPSARNTFAEEQVPYDGAKPMLFVDSEDAGQIAAVVESMLPELPRPKKKRC